MKYKKTTKQGIELEPMGDVELDPELDAKIEQMTVAADAEETACRVNFRWEKKPLELVKQAAASMGVPYQIYIKQVLYRQALADLKEMEVIKPFTANNAGILKALHEIHAATLLSNVGRLTTKDIECAMEIAKKESLFSAELQEIAFKLASIIETKAEIEKERT